MNLFSETGSAAASAAPASASPTGTRSFIRAVFGEGAEHDRRGACATPLHRSSPEREYEFIEFESPVDIWQVQAMINFYEGTAPGGPTGEIRIEFDGKLFNGHFSLAAGHGNKGRSGRSQGEFWTRIDVPTILKLPEHRPESAFSSRP